MTARGHATVQPAEDATANQPKRVTERADGPSNVDRPVSPDRPISPTVAQRLQRTAGNRAVARLVAQRRAATTPESIVDETGPVPVQRLAGPTAPAGPAAARPATPQADPKFAALTTDVRNKQHLLTAHPPGRQEADRAQAAALPPQDDIQAQGKAANAEKMNDAKPGEFDKAGFIKAVNDAIAAQAPKNLDEADKFGDSGKADAVRGQVAGKVGDGKKTTVGPVESATNAPPDTSRATPKPVTPLQPDQPPGTPGTPDPAKAVPDKVPPSETDFSGGPKQVDDQMAQAEVTEDQLARSNEPEFGDALKAKQEGEAHAATAPGEVRASEAQTLTAAKAQAGQAGAAAMTAMTGDRRQTGAALTAGKTTAKGSDEAKRAQVTATLQKVFDATKAEVDGILTGLDKKVDDTFTAGEKAARDAFTAEHKRRMDAYKDERYSGLLGAGRWIRDKFAGLPEEANQIFVQARAGYVARMQQVISSVADVISAELGRAKQRIAQGRADLKAEVAKLPQDLKAVGEQAAGEFNGKFDELTESVDAKGQELVQTLASKYKDAMDKVDEEIAAEKEKNKGLVAKAVDAVGGVIRTILQLKDMLLGVLAKAASAVMDIIKDPITFLGNLVSAIGAGLRGFIANIGEHLKKGLVGWLLGALSGAGLQLPARFDLRGILVMVASLLGLTWGAIRGRVVARGVPEQAMGAVEQTVPIAQKIQSEGIGGIWEEIKEKIGDLKENLFGKISEYLIPTVLVAGITWIVSLLNPASAFVKACKMIVDIVTFIVERGAQIIQFVNSVLDAVIAIAKGGTGGVPALIEKALANSIPVLIGALAAILGIGGVAEKVKKFFQSLSKPVLKAVDWVVGKIVGFAKKIWAKLKGTFGKKAKGTDPAGAGTGQPLKYQRAFSMHGEGHTLYAVDDGSTIRLQMASDRPKDLPSLIRQALFEARRLFRASGEDADASRRWQEVIGKLEGLEATCQQLTGQGGASRREEGSVMGKLATVVADLAELGNTYGLNSLQGIARAVGSPRTGDFIKDGYLRDRYRSATAIRDTFYGWYPENDSGGSKRIAERDRLRAQMLKDRGRWGTDPLLGSATSYYCAAGDHLRDWTTATGVFTLDHTPPMADHWRTTGRNASQDSRKTWFNSWSLAHLVGMCTSCNAAKNGPMLGTEDFKVGPAFTGPGGRV